MNIFLPSPRQNLRSTSTKGPSCSGKKTLTVGEGEGPAFVRCVNELVKAAVFFFFFFLSDPSGLCVAFHPAPAYAVGLGSLSQLQMFGLACPFCLHSSLHTSTPKKVGGSWCVCECGGGSTSGFWKHFATLEASRGNCMLLPPVMAWRTVGRGASVCL